MLPRGYLLLTAVVCHHSAFATYDCVKLNGVHFNEKQTTSATGERCLNWANISKVHNLTFEFDGETELWNHSLCGNPDASARPWCYVSAEGENVERQDCTTDSCQDQIPTPATATDVSPRDGQTELVDEPVVQAEVVAVKPDQGISRRVHNKPRKRKDLGPLGYALGILLMAIILMLGSGITLGYFYKRGVTLRQQREQRAHEQEMHRIHLPLSAFSNPACELTDEGGRVVDVDRQIVVQTDGQQVEEGGER